MMTDMDLYYILQKLNIEYRKIEHEAVFTVEQIQKLHLEISGTGCKNLFLTDGKGNYCLVILEENKKADMKGLAEKSGMKHLSFASESKLSEILMLSKGSVTPFGIINDKENKVVVFIDGELKNKTLLFHPNINTKTISVEFDDLIKFIEFENHKYVII